MLRKTLPFFFCIFALGQSCIQNGDVDEVSPAFDKEFSLNFFYTNPNGTDPVITLDRGSSSPEILIDDQKDIDADKVGDFLIDLNFRNIRIVSEGKNYEIVDVQAQNYINEDWERDIDFKTRFQSIPDMDVVLALDVSESLGEEFDELKRQAKEFITRLKEEAPGIRVGVVAFGTNIETSEISVNHQQGLNFIDGMAQSQFTKLYEGMFSGADMLQRSVGMNSKVLVTFTDGRDNFSDVDFTPSSVRAALTQEDSSGVSIQHNIVGYESNASVDRSVLESLAVNGMATFPTSIDKLEEAFRSFSNSVGTTYQIVYQRNTKVITDREALRFLIKAQRKKEN